MQVSWINPEDVAALAESLRTPPRQPAVPDADAPLPLLAVDGVEEQPAEEPSFTTSSAPATEQPEAVEAPPPLPAPPVSELHEPDASPDLQALRQRLQQIRERAMGAGLLPTQQISAAPLPPSFPTAPPSQPGEVTLPPPAVANETPPERTEFDAPPGSATQRLEAFAGWTHRVIGASGTFVVDSHGDLLWGPQDQAGWVLSTLMAMNASVRSSALAAYGSAQAVNQVMPSGEIMTVIPCQTRRGMVQAAVAAAQPLAADQVDLVCGALKKAMEAEG